MRCVRRTEIWNFFIQFDENPENANIDIQKNIREKALAICAEYLSEWKTIKLQDFKMRKVKGGFCNQMYLCESNKINSSERSQVLLRIQAETDNLRLMREAVVFSRLADEGLGPKLLGLFEGGRLEEYIPSRILTTEELRSPGIIAQMGPLLCRIHKLFMPTPYCSSTLDEMRELLAVYEETNGSDIILKPVAVDVLPNMTTVSTDMNVWRGLYMFQFPAKISLEDLKIEIDDLERRLKKYGGPLLFCHKDTTNNNILLKDGFEISDNGEITKYGEPSTEVPLVLIDFECSGYEYRGFELGAHIGEYANELGTDEHPFYTMDLTQVTEERFRLLCKHYAEQAYKLDMHLVEGYGLTGNKEKDVEILCKETSNFVEAGALYMGIYWLINADHSEYTGIDAHARIYDKLVAYYYFKNLRLQET